MTNERLARAEDTEAALQQAALRGVPIIIPGALQRANVCSPRSSAVVAIAPAAPAGAPQAAPLVDQSRLEYQRTGGGAPSERTGVKTAFTRLWRWVFVPA